MDQSQLMTITVVALVTVVVVAAFYYMRRRRTEHLKERFGPEYDRALANGSAREAEAALDAREKRVKKFHIVPLSADAREIYVDSWQKVQGDFVDDPRLAIMRADDLLGDVMKKRGYPVSDFEQRADDLSVDHPEVVQNYRTAHDITKRHSAGQASTEDLRLAMIHYRALFDDLVNEPTESKVVEERHRIKPLSRNEERTATEIEETRNV